MMQRLRRNGRRKAFFVATVSARALIIFEPTDGSFAQPGTNPHLKVPSWRSPSESVATA
jgi:hypothetical protein